MNQNVKDFGLEYFGVNDARQGIVHVIGPEQGMTQPGLTIVCGDSHTATHGASRCARDRRRHLGGRACARDPDIAAAPSPRRWLSRSTAYSPEGVVAKDVILSIIRKIGISGGIGHVIEYRGEHDSQTCRWKAA